MATRSTMRRLSRLPFSVGGVGATRRPLTRHSSALPSAVPALPRSLLCCRAISTTSLAPRRHFSSAAVEESDASATGSAADEGGRTGDVEDDDWNEEDDALIESQLEDRESDVTALTLDERVDAAFGNHPEPQYIAPSFNERIAALPQLYTATTITAHSEADALKYFPVTPSQHALIPPPLASAVSEEFRTSGHYLQFHPSYLPFITRLSSLHTPKGRFFLRKPWGVHGAHGVGKSALLYYLHLWANESGWLVVSVQGDEFTREKMGWHVQNKEREGLFDQPLYTSHFLGQLKVRQEAQLRKVQLKNKYEHAPNCTTLYDLLDLAHQDQQLAPTILYDFIDELRKATEVPVLVLIDNLNVWDVDSDYVDPSNQFRPLPARRLALVDAFSTFQHVAPSNGAAVFSTTSHATAADLPLHFNLRKVRPVLLAPYTHQQLKHALVHYHVSGLVLSDVDRQLVAKVKNLSGGMPKLVQRVAMAF